MGKNLGEGGAVGGKLIHVEEDYFLLNYSIHIREPLGLTSPLQGFEERSQNVLSFARKPHRNYQ